MIVLDSRTISGGFHPLQHEDYDSPPWTSEPWELALRGTMWGTRLRDRLTDLSREEHQGHWVFGPEDIGDMTGWLLWEPADKPERQFGAWQQVFGVKTQGEVERGNYTFGTGPIASLPLEDHTDRDERFASLLTAKIPYHPKPPGRWHALAVLATFENKQRELLFDVDPRHCIPDRGGARENGSIACDMAADMADEEVFAHRQTHERVTHIEGQYQLAVMGHAALAGGGGHGVYFGQGDGAATGGRGVAGWMAWTRGGLLHSGHAAADKHRVGINEEGEPEQPVHLWSEALIYKNRVEDGPINWTTWRQGVRRAIPTIVQLGFNRGLGKWDAWTTTPDIPSPEPPNPGDLILIPPGQPIWPGNGNPPVQPDIRERELMVQSIQYGSPRHGPSMPGDGRLGGPGNDTEFPDDSGNDSIEGGATGEEPFPTEPEINTDPSSLPPVSPIDDTAVPPVSELNEFQLREQRRLQHEYETGRRGVLSAAALERGGPIPFTVHTFGLSQVDVHAGTGRGSWAYLSTSRPGTHWGNGVARAAAYITAPGGFLSDGPDDQSDWLGDVDALLYNGYKGGNAVRRFGWGQWDQTTGDWSDGVVFEPINSSGTFGTALRFKNNAGTPAYWNGRFEVDGVLVGGTTGSNIGTGEVATSAVTPGDDTNLLTVGTDVQNQRLSFTEGGAAYTYNIDLDTTGAVEGNSFDLHLDLGAIAANQIDVVIRNGSGGSTLATISSTLSSGAFKRYVRAVFDGTAWVLMANCTSLS